MAAIDMLDSFLEQKHCTLWGIKKDIVDPKGRRQAAEWLCKTIEDVYTFNSGVPICLAAEAETVRWCDTHFSSVAPGYDNLCGAWLGSGGDCKITDRKLI